MKRILSENQRTTTFRLWGSISKNKLVISFIFAITAISFFLRLYQLGNVPNGLSADEADMAYNAFSILKTGKDVYGRHLPIFFQSLDGFVPGFGIYASIPTIYIFGLNDFAIRLLPAAIGALTPLLMYFLAKILYPKKKYLPIICAILTTFAPWNIAISRALWLYIELIFFYILFLIIFLLGIQKNFKLIILSALVLVLTQYIYLAAILYLPLIVITVTIIYRKNFSKNLKISLLALSLLIILSLPSIVYYLNQSSRGRLNSISIFQNDVTLPISISEKQQDIKNNDNFSALLHNRRLVYLIDSVENYFKYINFSALFVNSSGIRLFYVNYVGLFYLIELPFFLFGFLYLINDIRKEHNLLVASLFLIGPIPAIFILGATFFHRSILFLLAIQIISAVGINNFYEQIKKTKVKYWLHIVIFLVLVYMSSIYFFLHQYFIHSPNEFTSEDDNGAWFSTVKNAIPIVNENKTKYEKIVFTWSKSKLIPPVYFLFYNKVDPSVMQKKASGWTNEPPSYKQIYNQIDNIEFRSINWLQDKNLKSALFIGYPSDFPEDVKNVVAKTYLPNGEVHFLVVKNP
ncbi:MAG: hypothetical protein Q7S45_04330 [Candidatus Curtissbacteria bacterium]|nr:hypothetical protein [Candidatus Curtissbacteria bacterium]